jgi:hypothetical protein
MNSFLKLTIDTSRPKNGLPITEKDLKVALDCLLKGIPVSDTLNTQASDVILSRNLSPTRHLFSFMAWKCFWNKGH